MKKYLKPIIFLSIAGIIVLVMYLLSKPPDPSIVDETNTTPQSYAEIQTRCELLGKNEWNQTEYKSIKNAIATNSAGSATISLEQAEVLKNSLEKNYAASMIKSYQKWLDNLGSTDIQQIYAQMLIQSNISGCKYLLERPITVVKNYNLALTVSSMVANFKSNKFELAKYNMINNIITETTNTLELINFPDVINVFKEQKSEIDRFQDDVKDFDNKLKILTDEPNRKEQIYRYLKNNYCSTDENQITTFLKYKYYNDYLMNNICNQ
jgi:hypothetical protein